METLKKHQLTRLQKLAVQIKGALQVSDYDEDYIESSRLRKMQFQLTQVVFKHKL